jgi:hypothetical protein
MSEIKEFILMLPQFIKDILIGIMNVWLVIMWCILFPFIYIFDRLFGGWKNEKEKNDTRTS